MCEYIDKETMSTNTVKPRRTSAWRMEATVLTSHANLGTPSQKFQPHVHDRMQSKLMLQI